MIHAFAIVTCYSGGVATPRRIEMAAVPVTIIGTLTDNESTKNVTLAGLASLTGLEVGGGPIAPGGGPPSIWPSPGHPEHPIYIPPSIWGPGDGRPTPPIVIPPPPGVTGPPLEIKIVWTPLNQWQVVLVPTGEHPAPSATPAGSRR